MLKTHHQIVALSVTTTTAIIGNVSLLTFGSMGIISLLTTNLADIDRKIPMLKHRGLTHSLLTWFFLSGLLIYYAPDTIKILAITASLSYLSHIIMDSLSIAGVRLLYPLTANKLDNQYGIYLGTNKNNGRTIHHHFNYSGYRVGGRIETIITIIVIIIECGLLSIYLNR